MFSMGDIVFFTDPAIRSQNHLQYRNRKTVTATGGGLLPSGLWLTTSSFRF